LFKAGQKKGKEKDVLFPLFKSDSRKAKRMNVIEGDSFVTPSN